MTLRLDAGEADRIASKHEAAAEAIDDSAATAPSGLDAGAGTAYVLQILEAVSTTAGEIAVISQAVASQVRDCADDVGLTEQEIAAQFAEMNGNLR